MRRRQRIRSDVSARKPFDERERLSIRLFIEHFDRLEQPFDEHSDPVHVTGSAIVVGRRGVVLHRHKRLGIWLQPGGHVDADELPSEAAMREAYEETGLEVCHPPNGPDLIHVDVHPGPRGHTHLDLRYLLIAPAADPAPLPGESQDVRWFEWDDAIALSDPGLTGALVAQRDRLRAAGENFWS